eukprot:TRINITY_DN10546_c0_g1_i1.p1 TRINITY_DN10546_c0_g1~~TRINITY_DN10546_c0_g1_i1.p1  ORF type:complete len:139 (+),score=31.70 TRINITY_DN10546_c0_g1_i1:97-513(+)
MPSLVGSEMCIRDRVSTQSTWDSLAVVALKLKEIFGLEDVNDLPIAYNIAWYEQKAVIVLLALLYLGVKNIHLGPTLPAFLSPNVANVLVQNFGIAGIQSVDEDLKLFLQTEKELEEEFEKQCLVDFCLGCDLRIEMI